MTDAAKGVAAVVLACVIWGFGPVFYHRFSHVAAPEMLAHRTLWTLLMFGGILGMQRRLPELRALLLGPSRWVVLLATVLITANWFVFIWAVQNGHAVEASLGYYIFPLVAVTIGYVVFAERLTRSQVAAVAVAAVAVCVQTLGLGVAPVIALALAGTFAGYSTLKRAVGAPALVSVTLEVALMAPFALGYLAYAHSGQAGAGAGWFGRDLTTSLWLPFSGMITGGPLILFTYAARRISMATLGLVQYLNPTLQFLTALFWFAEPVSGWHLGALALIWVALAIYSAGAWRQDRAARKDAVRLSTSDTAVK